MDMKWTGESSKATDITGLTKITTNGIPKKWQVTLDKTISWNTIV